MGGPSLCPTCTVQYSRAYNEEIVWKPRSDSCYAWKVNTWAGFEIVNMDKLRFEGKGGKYRWSRCAIRDAVGKLLIWLDNQYWFWQNKPLVGRIRWGCVKSSQWKRWNTDTKLTVSASTELSEAHKVNLSILGDLTRISLLGNYGTPSTGV